MSLPFVFAVVLLSVVGATYPGRPAEHKCKDDEKVNEAYRFDETKFPKNCQYYCNTSSVLEKVWFGYYSPGEPCKDNEGETGTCKQQEDKTVVCNPGVKPPTC